MIYNSTTVAVLFDKREQRNRKILSLIRSGNTDLISREEVFNSFTGKGGLHHLSRKDYRNYHDYGTAKKTIEHGQFFTPHWLCDQVITSLQPGPGFYVADITCGMGNFFNYLPQHCHLYGNELDEDAATVCRFLYPQAKISQVDFVYYNPEVQFDLVIGNPPFHLDTDLGKSHHAYLKKSYELLKYGALLAVILPASALADELLDKHRIDWVNQHFNFIFQSPLPAHAFDAAICTKLLVLQKKGVTNSNEPYRPEASIIFQPATIFEKYIAPIYAQNRADAARLHLFTIRQTFQHADTEYKINKYLYHLKAKADLKRKYHSIALKKISQLKTQVQPAGMPWKEWLAERMTAEKILSWLQRIIKRQNQPLPQKKLVLVKTQYGLKYKSYHKSLDAKAWEKSTHELLLSGERLQPFDKLYNRKARALELQNRPLDAMTKNATLETFLKNFVLAPVTIHGELFPLPGEIIRLNKLQKHDLGIIFQKRYAQLCWQQGGGKSVAGMAWLTWLKGKYPAYFIVAPTLAVETTWKDCLTLYGFDFTILHTISDVALIQKGQVVVVSYERLVLLQRFIKKHVRKCSCKIAVLLDESDELTNPGSQRTQAALNCFRKAKHKLLTTGTSTRNAVSELYPQFELLYNNSTAFLCHAQYRYAENKEGEIIENVNEYYLRPFPAYRGNALFRACFCPHRTTVFGIKQERQDVYNTDALRELIEKTIISKKFEEIVGEKKYSIHSHSIAQTTTERKFYEKLLYHFLEVCYDYYTSTGNSRKEAALRIMRQILVLIKASSIPHLMKNFPDDSLPAKFSTIKDLVSQWSDERVTIGTILKDASRGYFHYLRQAFPYRKLLYIDGEVSPTRRKKILADFQRSPDGILVCTQASLKSSVNIPFCHKCIIESLQWNLPKMAQFYFRFIRFNSTKHAQVHFTLYENTIETNLLALLMAKEKLNEFVKTRQVTTDDKIYDEYDIDINILDKLIQKEYDADGRLYLRWGNQAFHK